MTHPPPSPLVHQDGVKRLLVFLEVSTDFKKVNPTRESDEALE